MKQLRLTIYSLLFAIWLPTAEAGDKLGFFVGVETYDPVFLNRLQYAEDDAAELAATLGKLGFECTLMTRDEDLPGRRPSSAKNILKQLELWLRTTSSDDTIIVGFSGHGVQFSEPRTLADGGEDDQFFCPEEADLRDVNTLVSMKRVIELLENCPAQRRLLLVDACRNEVLSDIGKSAPEIELDPAGVTPRSVPKGLVALYSCAQGEKSYELPDLQHGAFCYHVLKYLKGDAPPSEYRQDQISLRGLLGYASSATRRAVFQKLSQDQYPESVGRTTDWAIGMIPQRKDKTNSIGMKLKLIPAGEFMMGSRESPTDIVRQFPGESIDGHANQQPRHKVTLTKPFYLGVHEVTVGQFRKFVEETRYRTDVERGTGRNNPTGAGTSTGAQNWRNPGHESLSDRHPVSVVSYNDAQAFCRWLSDREGVRVRLPTQAEWEYACRAGSEARYSTGDDPEGLVSVANVPNRAEVFTLKYRMGTGARYFETMARSIGEVTFVGNNRDGFNYEFKNTSNLSSRVTIVNDISDSSVTIRTRSGDITIPSGGSRVVSLATEQQWMPREIEYYSGSDNGWLKVECGLGATVKFQQQGNAWVPIGYWSIQEKYDAGIVTIYNDSNNSTLYLKVSGQQTTISPGGQRDIDPGYVRTPSSFVEGRDGYVGLAPVGQFLPNAFGIHDMHGNVWEWCQDGIDNYAYTESPKVDPVGPARSSLFAIRGGCFL